MVVICLSLAGCSLMEDKVHIIDIKTATSVDSNLAPVQVTETFPEGTTKVFCWFKWKDSPTGTQLTAKWDYVSEKIHVMDYSFSIPRRNGMGGVLLTMPKGKTLPTGSYRITLWDGKQSVKSVPFEVA